MQLALGQVLARGSRLVGGLNQRLPGPSGQPQRNPGAQHARTGQAIVWLTEDESMIDFKLSAPSLGNSTQAHIQCGPTGANGPVVALLYGFGPVVSPDGVLSQGTITAADFIPRPDLAVCPGGVADLDGLIGQIQAGNTYVNVHTMANRPVKSGVSSTRSLLISRPYPAQGLRARLLAGAGLFLLFTFAPTASGPTTVHGRAFRSGLHLEMYRKD